MFKTSSFFQAGSRLFSFLFYLFTLKLDTTDTCGNVVTSPTKFIQIVLEVLHMSMLALVQL